MGSPSGPWVPAVGEGGRDKVMGLSLPHLSHSPSLVWLSMVPEHRGEMKKEGQSCASLKTLGFYFTLHFIYFVYYYYFILAVLGLPWGTQVASSCVWALEHRIPWAAARGLLSLWRVGPAAPACGILFPKQGSNPHLPAGIEVGWIHNCWTTRESQHEIFKLKSVFTYT